MKKIGILIILILAIFATVVYGKDIYKVVKDKCVGCYICLKSCPVNAIKREGGKAVIDTTKCIGCGLCAKVCPTKAIVKETIPDQQTTAAKTVTAVAGKAQAVAQSFKETYRVIKEKCISCFICVEKCPVKAIRKENGKAVIDTTKCISCGICANVCPTKAIEKVRIPIGGAPTGGVVSTPQPAKAEAIVAQKAVPTIPIVKKEIKPAAPKQKIVKEATVINADGTQATDTNDSASNDETAGNVFDENERQRLKEEIKRELKQEVLQELLQANSQTEDDTPIAEVVNEEPIAVPVQTTAETTSTALQTADNPIVAFVKSILRINKAACVTCKKCEDICPVKAIEIRNNKAIIDQTKCIGCMKCISACNYKAVYVVKGGK